MEALFRPEGLSTFPYGGVLSEMVSEPNRFSKRRYDGIDYMPKTSKRSQPNMDIPTQAPSQPILLNSTLSLPPVSLEPYPQK